MYPKQFFIKYRLIRTHSIIYILYAQLSQVQQQRMNNHESTPARGSPYSGTPIGLFSPVSAIAMDGEKTIKGLGTRLPGFLKECIKKELKTIAEPESASPAAATSASSAASRQSGGDDEDGNSSLPSAPTDPVVKAWIKLSECFPLSSQYTEQVFLELYAKLMNSLSNAQPGNSKQDNPIREVVSHVGAMCKMAFVLQDSVPRVVLQGFLNFATSSLHPGGGQAEKAMVGVGSLGREYKGPPQPKVTYRKGSILSTKEYQLELEMWISQQWPHATSDQITTFINNGFSDSDTSTRQMVNQLLSKSNTTEQAWDLIHNAFANANERQRLYRLQQFFSITIDQNEEISQFRHRYELTFKQIFLDPPTSLNQSIFVNQIIAIMQQKRDRLYERVVKYAAGIDSVAMKERVPVSMLSYEQLWDAIQVVAGQLTDIAAQSSIPLQQGKPQITNNNSSTTDRNNNKRQRHGNDNRQGDKVPKKNNAQTAEGAGNGSGNSGSNKTTGSDEQRPRSDRPCHDWKKGSCNYGDKCRFSHSSPTTDANVSNGKTNDSPPPTKKPRTTST